MTGALLADRVQDTYGVLFPTNLFFCCISTYSVNNNLHDVFTKAFFGLMGYTFVRLALDPALLMLGFMLGPLLEENFRRTLVISHGSLTTFVTRPISATR